MLERQALGFDVRASVVDSLLYGRDLLGFLVRNFHAEFVFQRHHEFDGVERVGAEVVHERCFVLDLSFGDAQLFRDDLLDALFDIVHYPSEGKKFKNASARILAGLSLQKSGRKVRGQASAERSSERTKARILNEFCYDMHMPPFTCSVVPVIYPACGEARNATACATSSGLPSRPSGICAFSAVCCSSGRLFVMSVSMKPGATQFTVMPRLPISRASARVIPATPAFAAA